MNDLRHQLQNILQGRACLIGVGEVEMGDDGFGVWLAEALSEAGRKVPGSDDSLKAGQQTARFMESFDESRIMRCGPEPRSAGFPACGLTGLSSPVLRGATGKSPEPADKNVCTQRWFMESGGWEIVVAGTSPERCLGRLQDGAFDHVLFLDAIELGAAPGSVALLDAAQMASALPQISTHRVSLGLLARLIEEGGNTKAWLLGVQPESLSRRNGLSRPVQASLEALADLMMDFPLTPGERPPNRVLKEEIAC